MNVWLSQLRLRNCGCDNTHPAARIVVRAVSVGNETGAQACPSDSSASDALSDCKCNAGYTVYTPDQMANCVRRERRARTRVQLEAPCDAVFRGGFKFQILILPFGLSLDFCWTL